MALSGPGDEEAQTVILEAMLGLIGLGGDALSAAMRGAYDSFSRRLPRRPGH